MRLIGNETLRLQPAPQRGFRDAVALQNLVVRHAVPTKRDRFVSLVAQDKVGVVCRVHYRSPDPVRVTMTAQSGLACVMCAASRSASAASVIVAMTVGPLPVTLTSLPPYCPSRSSASRTAGANWAAAGVSWFHVSPHASTASPSSSAVINRASRETFAIPAAEPSASHA